MNKTIAESFLAKKEKKITMSGIVTLQEVTVLFDISSDFHLHTTYSDGASSIQEMCQAALDRGLQSIAVTDHMPLPFATRYALAYQSLANYRREIETARELFRDRLTIRMGLEIEYISSYSEWIRDISALGWDHLIVSIHHLPGQNGLHLVNGTEEEFMPLLNEYQAEPKALSRQYYHTMQEAVSTGMFDTVGHLDVIKKFNPKLGYIDESSAWYRELVKETLDLIKHYGTTLEINTGGFNHPPCQQYPSDWIIAEARRRRIPISMGSDSHSSQAIGQYFAQIAQKFST